MFDVCELKENGYDPVALGMVLMGNQTASYEIPEIDVVADMKSRYDIDLFELLGNVVDGVEPPRIIGGVFADPHPDSFWDEVHQGHQGMIIVAGDTPSLTRAWTNAPEKPFNSAALMATAYIARVKGLMIRAYEGGVGTAGPNA